MYWGGGGKTIYYNISVTSKSICSRSKFISCFMYYCSALHNMFYVLFFFKILFTPEKKLFLSKNDNLLVINTDYMLMNISSICFWLNTASFKANHIIRLIEQCA